MRNLTIEMLASLSRRDWDEALAAIARGRKSDEAHELAKLYDLYEARIRAYRENAAAGGLDRRVCATDEVVAAIRRVGKAAPQALRAHQSLSTLPMGRWARRFAPLPTLRSSLYRHCEERSDEAIQSLRAWPWIASLRSQ